MIPITLGEIAAATSGRVLGAPTAAAVAVESICTDSRRMTRGSLFVALKGCNHDGHDHVVAALKQGAAAALVHDVSRFDRGLHGDGRLILVNDTMAALGQLAAWYRRQRAAQVIAVVGSNGKTTTKDLIAAVLSTRKRGRASQASFNNAIGVPLTLLSLDAADEFVVVEIGTNHPGEVASLARIAAPTMAVVTSIGEEHLEHFGDVESVAREEYSVLECLRDRSFVAVEQGARAYAPAKHISRHHVVTYGASDAADVRATDIASTRGGQTFRVNGRAEYRLSMLGRHNVVNALAAIAVGGRLRLEEHDIAAGLASVRPAAMRLEPMECGALTIINDAYNANPSSMKTAFDALDDWPGPGRRVLILGDMAELGDQAVRCHQAVGRDAGRSSAQVIIGVGNYARVVADGAIAVAGVSKRIYSLPDVAALHEKLPSIIEPGDVLLLKASRRVRLEQIVERLRELAAPLAASAWRN